MRVKGILLLVISLVLGLGAVQWVRGLANNGAQTSANIVAANTSLNFGDHIGTADLKLISWPSNAIPAGAFTRIEDVVGAGQDRVAIRQIEPNEPILTSKVSGPGGKASLSSVIDPTMRAMTIHVNDATGVAGFITPGDRVDILLTRDDNNNKDNSKTDILLQNVLVRGIDQEADEHKDKPTVVKAVTVEVTPDDAQKLTLGSNIGTLSLALRNMTSSQQVSTRSLSVKDLQPTVAAAVEGPRPVSYHVQIMRGTETTSYEVSPDQHVRPAQAPTQAKATATAVRTSAAQPAGTTASNVTQPATQVAKR
jgi:pilus assembly protein CpaB